MGCCHDQIAVWEAEDEFFHGPWETFVLGGCKMIMICWSYLPWMVLAYSEFTEATIGILELTFVLMVFNWVVKYLFKDKHQYCALHLCCPPVHHNYCLF